MFHGRLVLHLGNLEGRQVGSLGLRKKLEDLGSPIGDINVFKEMVIFLWNIEATHHPIERLFVGNISLW